ncbi:hypothetical protein ACNHFS_004716 [Yersinia enterocolitica]|nr:hypothetical protein [Yersinia enterocolitica]
MTKKIYKVGVQIETPKGIVEILEYINGYKTPDGKHIHPRAIIKFISTGTVMNVQCSNIKSGKISDYRTPTVYGVGYIGSEIKIPERGTIIRRIYDLWANMLKRAYGGYKTSYIGVTVDVRWHSFTNFLNSVHELDGYEQWEKGENYHLDKDTKLIGNTVYGKTNCIFIPAFENVSDSSCRRWGKA